MPPGFPDALRRTGKRFLKEYHSQLRTFENEYEVAPGVVVQRTGGHTPGHSVVRLASGGDRLMFAGDLVFQVGFEHPDWYNGFEHDPEEAARVRVRPAGAGGESRVAGGHSPVVPVRLPCGGRRRRLSMGTGPLGVLTACRVRAEPGLGLGSVCRRSRHWKPRAYRAAKSSVIALAQSSTSNTLDVRLIDHRCPLGDRVGNQCSEGVWRRWCRSIPERP